MSTMTAIPDNGVLACSARNRSFLMTLRGEEGCTYGAGRLTVLAEEIS